MGGTAPQMADGEGQRIRAVGRPRRVSQPQQPRDHLGDLRFAGPAAAGHRGLHLARGMQRYRNPPAGRADDGNRPSLRGAHHGSDIVLAEDPLDGHGIRVMLDQPAVQLNFQGQEPGANVRQRRGPDHVGADQPERATGLTLDNAHAAAGKTRIPAEHAHPSPSR